MCNLLANGGRPISKCPPETYYFIIRRMNAEAFEFIGPGSDERIYHIATANAVCSTDHNFSAVFGQATPIEQHFNTSPVLARGRVSMPDCEI
jgi:hypothetical protein